MIRRGFFVNLLRVEINGCLVDTHTYLGNMVYLSDVRRICSVDVSR
jgi:hypothetical protein